MSVPSTPDNTVGALLIGYVVSMFMCGILCAQVLWYYSTYPNDRRTLKIIVAILCVSELTGVIFCSDMIWGYLIVRGSTDPFFFLIANRGLIGMILPTSASSMFVDIFYIYRIWRLTNKSKYVALAFIPVLVYSTHVVGIVVTSVQAPFFAEQSKFGYFLSMADSFRIVEDVGIAAAMCTLMYVRRGSVDRSNSLLKTIFFWSLTTGVLTSIFIIASYVSYLTMPNNLIYIGFYLMYSKIGANAMLASLNMRNRLRSGSSSRDIHLQPLRAASG